MKDLKRAIIPIPILMMIIENKADKSASNSLYPSILEGLAPLYAPDADFHRQSKFHMHLVASSRSVFVS